MEVTACSSGRLGPTGVFAEPLRRIQKGQQGLNRAGGEEKWQRQFTCGDDRARLRWLTRG